MDFTQNSSVVVTRKAMPAIGTVPVNVPPQRKSTTSTNGPEPVPVWLAVSYVRRSERIHSPANSAGSSGMRPQNGLSLVRAGLVRALQLDVANRDIPGSPHSHIRDCPCARSATALLGTASGDR